MTMEIVVAVAIAILGTIFLAALVALIIVCSRHYCKQRYTEFFTRNNRDSRCTIYLYFLSPPVLMHGGLLGVAFCPSVCLSVRLSVRPGQILEKNSLEKKSYLRNHLT